MPFAGGSPHSDPHGAEREDDAIVGQLTRVLDGELPRSSGSAEEQGGGVVRDLLAQPRERSAGRTGRCVAVGMDDFIAEPTTTPFLTTKLREWLPHLAWPSGPAIPAGPAVAAGAREGGDGTDAALDPAVLDELTACGSVASGGSIAP